MKKIITAVLLISMFSTASAFADEVENETKVETGIEEVSESLPGSVQEQLVTKLKITKEDFKAKKEELKALKKEAKEYISEVKELFKDADEETKKELLKEIAEVKKELQDCSIGVFVKGIEIDFSKYNNVLPIIVNDRTLAPIRAVTEALGCEVNWDEATKTIFIIKDNITIAMQIDNENAFVNGETIQLDVAPEIVDDRTLVPMRFISEALNLNVDWDEESQTIIIE